MQSKLMGADGMIHWRKRKKTPWGGFSQENPRAVEAVRNGWLNWLGEVTNEGRRELAQASMTGTVARAPRREERRPARPKKNGTQRPWWSFGGKGGFIGWLREAMTVR